MKKLVTIFALIVFILSIAGCSNDSSKKDQNEETSQPKSNKSVQAFGEDTRLYGFTKKSSVVTFYITVADKNETSFYELDHWYSIHNSDTAPPNLDIKIQEGTESGVEKGKFGANAVDVNASIELRGKSTRVASQKSFKIKLSDSAGLWNGQKTLNLNKHPYDATRVRNKLSFDYFTLIPGLTSMRTQFVHLYVKDLTNKHSNGQFVDYGLYTEIEQANERFLAAHGLDSNGNLYKATNFEFYRYPEQLKLESDSSYSKAEFEKVLETKGSKDHRKLILMLNDVNNYSLNINDVIKKHFDRGNYLTWMATNLLMGNHDVTTQNFYLYSPSNSEKWYFLPWDYDGAWSSSSTKETKIKYAPWQEGLSNYWGSVLNKRFFKDPDNVKELSKKIEEVSKIITPQQTRKLLDEYYPTVSQFINRTPDKNYLGINVSDYKDVYYGIVNGSELNKQIYYKNLEKPMPFFLAEHIDQNKHYVFEWDASYDLQGDDISYTFQVSKDPAFTHVVQEQKGIVETKYMINSLEKGTYYWRVISKDAKGNEQGAFDQYEDEDGTTYYGVQKIIVN